jgi:uncharacterized protein (TIGR03084 family)
MPTVEELCRDLTEEHDALHSLLVDLREEDWVKPTPAAGWDVRDSLSHLCYFDETAALAASDPEMFEIHKRQLHEEFRARNTPDIALGRSIAHPRELLDRWQCGRRAYIEAILKVAPKSRVPWYRLPMSAASLTTARIMEAWAHGTDIRDALGAPTVPTSRLRHVCHIGYLARAYTFVAHEIDDPGDAVRLSVRAPDGVDWLWGPENASNRIAGDAIEVAMIFTQRRHYSRTSVQATGSVATQWLGIAQAFAGPGTTASLDR